MKAYIYVERIHNKQSSKAIEIKKRKGGVEAFVMELLKKWMRQLMRVLIYLVTLRSSSPRW